MAIPRLIRISAFSAGKDAISSTLNGPYVLISGPTIAGMACRNRTNILFGFSTVSVGFVSGSRSIFSLFVDFAASWISDLQVSFSILGSNCFYFFFVRMLAYICEKATAAMMLNQPVANISLLGSNMALPMHS
jgi:hypothetical protein